MIYMCVYIHTYNLIVKHWLFLTIHYLILKTLVAINKTRILYDHEFHYLTINLRYLIT